MQQNVCCKFKNEEKQLLNMKSKMFYSISFKQEDETNYLKVLGNDIKDALDKAYQIGVNISQVTGIFALEYGYKYVVKMNYNINGDKCIETHEFESLHDAIRCLEERNGWGLSKLRIKYGENHINSGISEDETMLSAECNTDSFTVNIEPMR